MKNDISSLTAFEKTILQAFVRELHEQFDGQMISVLLLGSRARGDAQPDSDIDIAVIVNRSDLETVKTIRDLAADIWLEYGLFLSTCVWSQEHWRRLEEIKTGFYRSIQREGIDVLSAFAK